ncbi:arylsulfatase [Pseudonocardia kunmingensis]|uniref:Arylsulfatase n=1 Tax=Pseudonocardia kunmingensis TaxID=630975 RepID=A0A543DIP7_9PSEU|nr:arylsulfatase [Pseudonocardia kunmingensis]TQM09208.1 arylsulfatase [Pseudonocardia kunmingensis]
MTNADQRARPDVLLILADDMGFSDIASYGGEVRTPALDRLAEGGVRMTQFYNTARCSPSRASLMTGLHPHQVGIGILNFDDSPDGYPGNLSEDCATVAEVLGDAGYATYLSGKWHLAVDMDNPNSAWPTRRGFDRFFGTLEGAGSFYQPRTLVRGEQNIEHEATAEGWFYTDAISDSAVEFLREHEDERPDDPFFMFLSYTAPHWPLHAAEEDIATYANRFDEGWDALREQRMKRLVDSGIISPEWDLSDRDERVPAWADAPHKEWEASRMEVYAAQIDRMDQGIAKVLRQLEDAGRLENTLVVFLSDNGGCAEEMPPESVKEFVGAFVPLKETSRTGGQVVPGNVPGLRPGPEETYQSYGRAWANLSNTPFREYKHWVHEGGISTPFIVHWPAGLQAAAGGLCTTPSQLVDVLPTIAEVAGAAYPAQRGGRPIPAPEGRSLLPALRGEADADRDLFWEHEGNCAVRRGRWKLVRKYRHPWELYDIDADRTELHDRASEHPDLVAELESAYAEWAQRCGVIPREKVLQIYAERGHGLPEE